MIGFAKQKDHTVSFTSDAHPPRLWMALLLASAPIVAGFTLPTTGIEGVGVEVADSELAEMRGRFVSADGISYFGLQLQTSWQGTDGITTYANVLFNVDFASGAGQSQGATPHLLVGWSRDGDSSMDVVGFGPAAQNGYVAVVTSPGTMDVGGLNSVQGAVQSQNIAGAGNNVRNDMSIAVVPASSINRPNGQGLTEVTSGSSQTFSDGDAVHFILGSNAVGLALSSGDGPDGVRQNVDGVLNHAAQHVLLASDLNAVHNSMNITIGLNELRQMDSVRVDHALSTMKGRGF
jgi:hypothetical protein